MARKSERKDRLSQVGSGPCVSISNEALQNVSLKKVDQGPGLGGELGGGTITVGC